jgi:hypothetical protein
MKSYLLILAVLYFSLSNSQTLSINITEKKFGLDQIHLIIVSSKTNHYYVVRANRQKEILRRVVNPSFS